MHHDGSKFWEISTIGILVICYKPNWPLVSDLVTISRAGKLRDNFVEEDKSI